MLQKLNICDGVTSCKRGNVEVFHHVQWSFEQTKPHFNRFKLELIDAVLIEFFTTSNFARSDISQSKLPLSAFTGMKYLLKYSSKCQPL